MIKFYSRPIVFFFAALFLLSQISEAQTITTPYSGGLTSFASVANISFVVENTNSGTIILNDIGQYCQTTENNSVWELYYSTTSLSGSSTVPGTGWTLLATSSATPVAADGIVPVFSNLNLTIPAGTQYRFVMKNTGPGSTRYVLTPSPSLTLFTIAGVNLKTGTEQIAGENVGYSGQVNALGTTPRYWHGSIGFVPGSICTSPPIAGATVASPATQVCPGDNVTLSLTGNTSGTGQTLIWKSSATLGGTYTDISTSQASPIFIVNPTTSTYYRAAVTCGGQTELSTPVQVVVGSAFPAGTYTINSTIATGSGNFNSFTDAVNAIKCGITGPVVFNVSAGTGPYTEQVTIPVINNTSAINSVTFNGNGAVLQFTPVTGTRHILKLDGADYVTIDSLNIIGLATDFDWGIHLTNAANNNTIRKCVIDLNTNTSTTAANSAGIVASASNTAVSTTGNNASNLTISGCTIRGGYTGIILSGLATSLNAINNVITNNTILDTYGNGIELIQNDGALVQRNDISRPSRTNMLSTAAGIELGAGNKNVTVNANKIHDTHTNVVTQSGTAYGIYFASCDAPVGSENKVTNNLIYNFNSLTGTQYGLYNSGSAGVFYYHNTVVLDNSSSTAGTTYAFYQTTAATNIVLRNNVFYVTRAGSGLKNDIRFNTTTSSIISNNNDLYISSGSGTVGVGYYGSNFVTLADWKNANSGAYDQQSYDHDPQFAADYVLSNPLLDNIGGNVGIATDIRGNARTIASPDPGAYEFSSGVDAVPPVITFTPLQNTSALTNRTLSVTITDLSGIRTGANGPRLYYRKAPSVPFIVNSSPVISGTTYTFTIDHALIGGVTAGSTVEYYVAAQDSAGNSITSPAGGSGTNPPGTTAPPTLNNYTIIAILTGNFLVGPGQTYEKLTNLATALNNHAVEIGGNVVFELSNAYDGASGETLPIVFKEFVGTSPEWTVTIRPASGATARITSGDPGSAVGLAIISVEGGDRYIFDGRPGSAGNANEWTIRNTRSTATIGGALRLADDATNNTFRNLNLESQATSTTTGVVFFHTSTGEVGNSYNTLMNNNIKGRLDVGSSTISNGILSTGSAAAPNHDNIIVGNHISEFINTGISLTATGNGPNWIIKDNHLYNNAISTATQNGINIASANSTNILITGNFIGGNAPNASGTWSNSGNVVVSGVTISNGIANIIDNTISNISSTSTGTTARIRGVLLTTLLSGKNVKYNTISNITTTSSATGIAFNNAVATGITLAPNGEFANDTIVGNKISNISIENTNALAVTNIAAGMSIVNLQTGIIANNVITDIKNKSTGTTAGQPPVAAGITNGFSDNGYVVNNMISLGATENTNTQFAGIWQGSIGTGNTHHYYNNTVLISGSASGNISSFGFVRGVDTSTRQMQVVNIRNNIFSVTRSGGGSANYAIGSRGAVPGGGWTSNFNDLHNTNLDAIGYWNATGYDFGAFRTISGGEANSITVAPVFVSPNDLHLVTTANAGLDNLGTSATGVSVDIDGQGRSPVTPDMGADEFRAGTCTATTWTGAISSAWEVAGNWTCDIPNATTDVIIPAEAVVVINSAANARSLASNTTASITVNSGASLTIHN